MSWLLEEDQILNSKLESVKNDLEDILEYINEIKDITEYNTERLKKNIQRFIEDL